MKCHHQRYITKPTGISFSLKVFSKITHGYHKSILFVTLKWLSHFKHRIMLIIHRMKEFINNFNNFLYNLHNSVVYETQSEWNTKAAFLHQSLSNNSHKLYHFYNIQETL